MVKKFNFDYHMKPIYTSIAVDIITLQVIIVGFSDSLEEAKSLEQNRREGVPEEAFWQVFEITSEDLADKLFEFFKSLKIATSQAKILVRDFVGEIIELMEPSKSEP